MFSFQNLRFSTIALGLAVLPVLAALASRADEQSDDPANSGANQDGAVSFVRDVAPILVRRCVACHGGKKAESNYRLDTHEALLKAGDFDLDPITAEDIDDSELFRLIISEDTDERMPKDGKPLTESEITKIRLWIEQGAKFDGEQSETPLVEIIPLRPYPEPPAAYSWPVPITALAFEPGGNELFVGGYHEITVWNPQNGELTRRIGDLPQRIHALAFSPDGGLVAVAGGSPGQRGDATLFDPKSGQVVKSFGHFDGVVFDVAFRPDGQKIATAGEDRAIRIFDVETGSQERAIENHSDWVTDIAWSPDGTKIASASRDKTTKLFNVETGELLKTHSEHSQPVWGVTFDPEGKRIFSAGSNDKIHVWNVEDGKKTGEIAGFGGDVHKLILTTETVFSVSADKTARLHKLADLQQLHVLSDHSDWVLSVAIHPATKRLATGCFDGQVRIWNTEDASEVSTFIAAPRADTATAGAP